ncbi:hypothetical protein AcW1_008416 [Taiwanofungus camphoratus]|nr:hypothetical protein AcV5_008708 [Antrodia cinnamomea]KAI0951356.1 hypothetical protein AcW1_008416 [Antrodia cinnamomea]KAI0956262.1 hypothetical protein AcV7_006706 [Antrodia cinnamomea]
MLGHSCAALRYFTIAESFHRYTMMRRTTLHTGPTSIPRPPPSIATLDTPANNAQARAWLAEFKTRDIPKSLVDLTYSRSSGPGGQNVNKVNTKATLRCPLNSSWIPMWATEHLKKTPFYVSSTQSIQITSTVYRSQAQNVQDCLSKLHALVLSASSTSLVNEPSDQQKERVQRHARAEKNRRRADKDKRSAVKKSRSRGYLD